MVKPIALAADNHRTAQLGTIPGIAARNASGSTANVRCVVSHNCSKVSRARRNTIGCDHRLKIVQENNLCATAANIPQQLQLYDPAFQLST